MLIASIDTEKSIMEIKYCILNVHLEQFEASWVEMSINLIFYSNKAKLFEFSVPFQKRIYSKKKSRLI